MNSRWMTGIQAMIVVCGMLACGSGPSGEEPLAAGEASAESEPPASTDSPPAGAPAPSPVEPTAAAPATEPEPPVVLEVEAGTDLPVRLARAVSSRTDKTGDRFEALLDRDLVVDGVTVASRGTVLRGRLSAVTPSGRVKGRASMTLTLDEILIGGDTLSIRTDPIAIEAEGSEGKDAAVIGGAGGVGALVGGLIGGKKGAAIGGAIGGGAGTARVLTTSGKEVEFGAEQEFSFTLSESLEVEQPH